MNISISNLPLLKVSIRAPSREGAIVAELHFLGRFTVSIRAPSREGAINV